MAWPEGGTYRAGNTLAQDAVDNLTADLASKAAASHTHAQADVTNLVTDLAAKQPLDTDLTTIAGLTATTDNFMVAASSAWASRTPAQAKTSLALVKGDVGLGSVDNTSDAAKPVSTATQTALDAKQALDAQLTSLAALAFTGNASKVVRVNAGETDFELATAAAGSDVSWVVTGTDTVAANKQRVMAQLQINDGGGIFVIENTGILAIA